MHIRATLWQKNFFFQSTITFFNGKSIYFISLVNSNVRFELLQKVVQYEKDTA